MGAVTIIYIVTIVISIIVALWLARLARLTSQAKIRFEEEKEKKRRGIGSDIPMDESLNQIIFQGINEVVGSKQRSEEVSKIVSSIVSKELERRAETNNQKLDRKYKDIIEQKTQSQDIAWKKYKKVLADKKETEAVIRSIAEGLVVVDPKGNVIMMNPAAEKLLGVSGEEKIGTPISENVKKDQLISLTKSSSGGKEIEIISQGDETKKILRSSSAVIEDKNGQTVGMVSVLSDITKQKELQEMKSSFVSNVTHELRTPLVAVQKSIYLLLNETTGQISETQREFLSLAERNLKRLGILIDDLLDLSKLEAGKMQIKRKYDSIEKVIDESVGSLHLWARSKSIRIDKKIQKDVPDVNLDPDRIVQVLNNLIGNAIKFTPENGNITISATLKNDDEVELVVQDTGIGISKEDLPKVFDKFYQTGERIPTDISGTGVGLSIAKEIVELHGGKIWAESEKGNETKFIFTLPIK
ncbi:MAG: PAS domain S-box protein [Candidatus Omnitrophica bacterium]|nr:PAS domain S-box protein [Candidatus Omnitrophota bacterium]